MTDPVKLLVDVLRDPQAAAPLGPDQWTSLITAARAESLIGSLAHRLHGIAVPTSVERLLEGARRDSDEARRQALWEAEMARRALLPLGIPIVLLKGTAYAAAGLAAGIGRSIGDLDILVPRTDLDRVEAALLAAGWEWVKEDAYDDEYYRRWMHELPPLIHKERDRMIDVHHTILPLTHRSRPDPTALIEGSQMLASGLRLLSPPDLVVHCAAHLIADGDLSGGLRNLWDLHNLLEEFGGRANFWSDLDDRAARHQLGPTVRRAVRLASHIFGTPVPAEWQDRGAFDLLFKARLLARNGWGRPRRKGLRFAFYVRSHWLRMPPLMLARHLWTKSRRRPASG
jgi:hypothetical protein